ncbi:MAG: YkgJ family cysteine cluster protein [Spirochaetaceae bacterium]|jgi:Fe-S-cluster containining protein|nr:YkgJ family cysteine cluster protein [Spirochaetaceae bacterium]
MPDQPFYAPGLRFTCARCSACCRYESGFVFLSEKDALILAKCLKMSYTSFIETYCRWVPAPEEERLSLKETSDFDCIFWNNGCSVYEGRPLQCRTFPFWQAHLRSQQIWDRIAEECPGMGKGTLFTRDDIESCLQKQSAEPLITRKRR